MALEKKRDRAGLSERLSSVILLAAVILLYALFLKDILIPFLRMELHHDLNGAQELLREKGLLGFLAVTLVEALQMVLVFIPAEFIQISSGLSYPLYLAVLLCDLGACLGASIIFVLVRAFGYNSTAYKKNKARITNVSPLLRDRNTVLFMYLLFLMPIIPFGAICYYGSGTKLGYGKYIRTVATGVIPSILVSNLMGAAGEAFLLNDIPFWILVLLIFVLALLLFAIIFLFMEKIFFKEYDGTPDSPMYGLIFLIARLWHGAKPKPEIYEKKMDGVQAPYILLTNHESFFDFFYIHQLPHPKNPTYLVNEYYCTRPILRGMGKRAGIIPKKLFTPEISSPVRIQRALKKGYPVVIFPEGRLSPDGRSNPIVDEGAVFFKRLNVDLVLVRIRGAYYASPKWRKKRYRTAVSVTVEDVIKKEDLRSMDDKTLNRRIAQTLYNDASKDQLCIYPQKDKAVGLGDLLYRCADCGALYTVKGTGNDLVCSACGSRHSLDEHYRFTEVPGSIPGWYEQIREMEKAELDTLDLHAAVRTLIHGKGGGKSRRETGECKLTPESFSYQSDKTAFSIPTEKMNALAFSCGKEFELYHEGELYYFYPIEQRCQVARWALAVDLLTERRVSERDKKTGEQE